jgi:hypothetical protein
MNVRRYAALAALGVVVAGVHAPADAAAKKKKPPVTKSYTMQLAPVPDPPQGSTCERAELEGVSIHTEKLTTTGAGTLKMMVSGFSGDWDITLMDAQRNELAIGDGTSTGGGAPATAGVDTLELSFKKAGSYLIAMCNFAGTPQAKGTYTYTYK